MASQNTSHDSTHKQWRETAHMQVRGAYSLTWAHRENTGGRLLWSLQRPHLCPGWHRWRNIGVSFPFLTWSCSLRQAKILSLPGIWITGNPSPLTFECRDSDFWRKCPFPFLGLSVILPKYRIVFLQRTGTVVANEISALLNISHALGILQLTYLFIYNRDGSAPKKTFVCWNFLVFARAFNSGVKGQRRKRMRGNIKGTTAKVTAPAGDTSEG